MTCHQMDQNWVEPTTTDHLSKPNQLNDFIIIFMYQTELIKTYCSTPNQLRVFGLAAPGLGMARKHFLKNNLQNLATNKLSFRKT